MDQAYFIGMLVIALGTIVTLGVTIIRPIINLNKSITKLNDSIDRLNELNDNLDNRVTKHGQEIDENTKKILVHEEEIKHLKEKVGSKK